MVVSSPSPDDGRKKETMPITWGWCKEKNNVATHPCDALIMIANEKCNLLVRLWQAVSNELTKKLLVVLTDPLRSLDTPRGLAITSHG